MIPELLLAQIADLARKVPLPLIEQIALRIEVSAGAPWTSARGAVLQEAPVAQLRRDLGMLLDNWYAAEGNASRLPLAWALRAAAQTASAVRAEQRSDLVWTGPRLDGPPLRRTDQALQEVIAHAHESLLLVSFAVYVVPHIRQALVDAAARGVRIQIVLETIGASDGRIDYDTVAALGPAVTDVSTIYTWPLARRLRDEQGRIGAMHAKCAVADEELLFVSSANLTGYALALNMELGLLVRGGPLPAAVWMHFQRLMEGGALVSM